MGMPVSKELEGTRPSLVVIEAIFSYPIFLMLDGVASRPQGPPLVVDADEYAVGLGIQMRP